MATFWSVVFVVGAMTRPPPWKNPRIHNFGNHGFLGAVHAALAPFATYLIDQVAYEGYDVRQVLRRDAPPNTLDLGSGVGLSTSPKGIGVDASREMIEMAQFLHRDSTFVRGLAETYGTANTYPRVTCAFLLHEQPQDRRRRILRNALRVTSREVLVMDIHPSYEPSWMMKTGEPYIDDYLAHNDADVVAAAAQASAHLETVTLCNGRVILYNMTLPA